MTGSSLTRRALATLLAAEGQAVLAGLAARDLSETQTLALLGDLRRHLPPDIAGAALTLARLRQRAASKFTRASRMVFSPDALEQASGESVATWRAGCVAAIAPRRIADLGCGIGGDTLALAGIPDAQVVGLDLDALRLDMARANLAAYGRAALFVQADLTAPLPLHGVDAAFFDPARRVEGRRIFHVRDYVPALDVIATWTVPALAVKLSPGVDLDDLRPYTAPRRGALAGVEFISVSGELKEAVLWRGAWGFAGRRATRLDPSHAPLTLVPHNAPPPPLSTPRAILYEPDPAVIRAGLFGELVDFLSLPLYRLDESIAYLTGDARIDTPWLRGWPVWEWMPFNLKRLRAALRARGITRVTVKKRGSPLTPEGLIGQLKLKGDGDSAVIVLTQVGGQHCALLCGEMIAPGDA